LSYDGNKVIVVSAIFNKMAEAFALPDAKAETVARVFVEQCVSHGAPKSYYLTEH